MKKLSLLITLLGAIFFFGSKESFASELNAGEQDLQMIQRIGFGSEGHTATHIFDTETSTVKFYDSVSLINPGTHTFTENSLIGISPSGQAELIESNLSPSSIGFGYEIRFEHKIERNYPNRYVFFIVSTKYRDNLWGNERVAYSRFALPGKDINNADIQRVKLSSALNRRKVVSTSRQNSNIVLWDKDNGAPQILFLLKVPSKGNNVYQIYYDYWLSGNQIIAWNDYRGSREVFLHPNENKDEHFWQLEWQNDGGYIISNYKDSRMVLDVRDGKTSNGTRLQVWQRNGHNAQKFYVENLY